MQTHLGSLLIVIARVLHDHITASVVRWFCRPRCNIKTTRFKFLLTLLIISRVIVIATGDADYEGGGTEVTSSRLNDVIEVRVSQQVDSNDLFFCSSPVIAAITMK